jgi:hypothetical protein
MSAIKQSFVPVLGTINSRGPMLKNHADEIKNKYICTKNYVLWEMRFIRG